MKYVLYNPLSGNGKAEEVAKERFSEGSQLIDMTTVGDMRELYSSFGDGDAVILLGGDGTINRFVNDIGDAEIRTPVYLLPVGTGNDFAKDIDMIGATEPFEITEYIRTLPTVTVDGKSYKFINNVGFGIDGYCCEVGDKEKAMGKQPNYTSIAIFGMLFHFKPCDAIVTVDGVEHEYKKVWIAPTMNGRFYGGGMMPTPEQSRTNPEHKLSVMLFHGSNKLRTLMIFPSIFKGEHIKATKYVEVLEGKEISVRFTAPQSLQIDGETHLGITEYTAKAYAKKAVTRE